MLCVLGAHGGREKTTPLQFGIGWFNAFVNRFLAGENNYCNGIEHSESIADLADKRSRRFGHLCTNEP